MGYDIANGKLQADDWFQRVWDTDAETQFLPQPVAEKDTLPVIDLARTVTCLSRGSTISRAAMKSTAAARSARPIEMMIEMDQYSQAGRGLKMLL